MIINLFKFKADLEKEDIPKNSKFWMIDYLYAEIADNYRIVLIPEQPGK